MPPNIGFDCRYGVLFTAVLREYSLPVDPASAAVLRTTAATCPAI